MFILDNRAAYKGKEEIMRDTENIVKAMKQITGLKDYSFKNKEGIRVNRYENNRMRDIIKVNILDRKETVGTNNDITFVEKVGMFRRERPIENYSALGYGDVVYIQSPSNKVFVWVRGEVILEVQFPTPAFINLSTFALHVQDSLKNHTFVQFKEKLKEDLYFWKEIEVYSN